MSREEVSQITVEFIQSRDPNAAANDVRDRVARTRGLLPEETDDPVVAKIEADAQAIIWLAFSSDRMNPLEITDYADRIVADQLKTLPGVASVIIGGQRRYAMRIWLDPDRMAALGVTVQDVESALRSQNAKLPSGRIESQTREFTVLAETDLKTPAEFDRLILRDNDGTRIPFVTIPVSLIGAFIFLYAMGFTINVLPLLGLVLAIGLVVDDAIVMLENIYRHTEEGMKPYEAAMKGPKEIGFAVAAAALVSSFVALTLTPMMASKLLRHEPSHNAFFNFGERVLNGLDAA